jgi:hypothetical protein
MRLYHTSVYVPKTLRLPNGQWTLNYSGHAQRAAQNDRYGKLNLPEYIDTRYAQLIEIEVGDNGLIQKLVYRLTHDINRDISLAIIPERRGWYVKTVWGNLKSDKHLTLNTSRYDRS